MEARSMNRIIVVGKNNELPARPFTQAAKRLVCERCDGTGQVFGCFTINPSERPHWEECSDCNGRGSL
jgi:DnaJ-class molecular chaperone